MVYVIPAAPVEVEGQVTVASPLDVEVTAPAYQSAVIDISTLGQNQIVASPGAGSYLAIRKLVFVCAAAVSVTFYRRTDDGGTAQPLSGAMPFSANGGVALDLDSFALTTGDNQGFSLNLSAAVAVTGFVMYTIETS